MVAGLSLTVIHLLAMWGARGLYRLSKPPMSYVVGMIVLGIPYIVLLLHWDEKRDACAFVVTVIVGGAPVIAGHILKKIRAIQKENEILRGELNGYGKEGRLDGLEEADEGTS